MDFCPHPSAPTALPPSPDGEGLWSAHPSRRRPGRDHRLRREPSCLRAAVHISRIGIRQMLAGKNGPAQPSSGRGDAVGFGPDQAGELGQLARAEIDIGAIEKGSRCQLVRRTIVPVAAPIPFTPPSASRANLSASARGSAWSRRALRRHPVNQVHTLPGPTAGRTPPSQPSDDPASGSLCQISPPRPIALSHGRAGRHPPGPCHSCPARLRR